MYTPTAINIVKRPLPALQLTKEKVKLICLGIEHGLSFEVSAQSLGLSPRLAAQVRRDAVAVFQDSPRVAEFSEGYLEVLSYLVELLPEAEAKAESSLVEVLHDAALGKGSFEDDGPSPEWALKVLERRYPQRWSKTNKQEVKHVHETAIGGFDPRQLTTAELEALVVEGEVYDDTPRIAATSESVDTP